MRVKYLPLPSVLIPIAAILAAMAIWLTLSILGVLPISAQSTQVELRMTVEPDTIYIGDPFTITLTATYPQDHFVVFPRVDSEWRNPNDESAPVFEVRNQVSLPTVENGDGTLTSSIQIEAVLFTTGDVPTPELSVAIRKPGGEIINRPVRPIEVSVTPLELEEGEELKDIEPQAVLPVPPDPHLVRSGTEQARNLCSLRSARSGITRFVFVAEKVVCGPDCSKRPRRSRAARTR